VRFVPAAGGAKPAVAGAFGAAAPGAFGAAPAFGGGAFGAKPAGGMFGAAQPAAAAAAPAVDPAKAAAREVKTVKFFSSEHFIAAPPPEDKVPEKGRARGSAHSRRPEISDLKQRPLVMERFASEKDHGLFPQYIVVLDRAKHTVTNTFGQTDAHKACEVVPRPGPDNLFQMLAILAIEIKVPICPYFGFATLYGTLYGTGPHDGTETN